MKRRSTLLFVAIFGALVAAVIAIAARYGPTCEIGEERCEDGAIMRCVVRPAARDTGRTWIEIARCGRNATRCEIRSPGAVCIAEGAATCEGVRCPEGTFCYVDTTLDEDGGARSEAACATSW